MLVLAHTLQVWTWSLVFSWITDLPDLVTSFYFATVTYTTLGYGDIVLGPDARIVATFCAITGLLTFGISTAFLIGVLSRVLPDVFEGSEDK
ncbi:MAG: ion channel [Paracoccaceae bacterium]